MNLTAPLSVAERLAMILEGLYRAVAARSARGIFGPGMATLMILMVCRRVRRIEGKIQRMLARFRTGTLRVGPVARGVGVAPRDPTAKLPQDPTAKLPRSFGWLLPLVPCHAAGFGSQLRHLLGDPEMMALLAASPQARRVLAPMCRMLAIEASVLVPEAPVGCEAEVDEAAPVVAKRVRKPRPPVDWGRIPIPRGVVSAVRRRGLAKDG